VCISQGVQLSITSQAISSHYGSRLNARLYSTCQTISGCVRHTQKTNSPNAFIIFLGSDNYQSFPCRPTATFSRPFTTDISLILLQQFRKDDHGPAEPLHDATCASRARLFGNYPSPRHVADRGR
jgi:hypothetical protein